MTNRLFCYGTLQIPEVMKAVTGISDGATVALMCSLQQNLPFTAFAPVAGVLPPMDISSAKGKRIYWVHGTLDWMFPVHNAQSAAEALKAIGADVTLRVIDDLSHTYPREENDGILKWFDPGLALPEKLCSPQSRSDVTGY